jgi:hypothetical protein
MTLSSKPLAGFTQIEEDPVCGNTTLGPFAWLSRYRRLNTIFERSKEHLIAFVAIAFISILSRLVVEELNA